MADPHYRILVGRLYDRLQAEYPVHEQLPTVAVPDEFSAHLVQHRFRKAEGGWPLVQVGPGILTLNATSEYAWEDFRVRVMSLLEIFFDAYPGGQTRFVVSSSVLRYINAVRFDYGNADVFDFLRKEFRLGIDVQHRLFAGSQSQPKPLEFNLRFVFPAPQPVSATVHLGFLKGKRLEEDALIWEVQAESTGDSVPQTVAEIGAWLQKAHSLINEGKLGLMDDKVLQGG